MDLATQCASAVRQSQMAECCVGHLTRARSDYRVKCPAPKACKIKVCVGPDSDGQMRTQMAKCHEASDRDQLAIWVNHRVLPATPASCTRPAASRTNRSMKGPSPGLPQSPI